MTKKLTIEEFIEKAKEKHGDKYDYSLVEYINSSTKIKIICQDHGEFEQLPSKHLSNQGCSKCSGHYQYTTEEFIEKAKEKHEDKYDYSNVIYKKGKDKIKIICKEHGEFEQIAHNHIMGAGCPKCANILKNLLKKKTTYDFIKEAVNIHNNKYDYSLVEYIGCFDKIKIICKEHCEFKQAPSYHLQGQGCSKCSGKYQYTTEEFIEKAIEVHGNKYDYNFTEYKTTDDIVKIICKEHGLFKQTPHSHLQGKGCSKCTSKTSKPAQQWIDYLSLSNPEIQHFYSENGEYSIPNSKYKADGYDEETNTIYEFHGDFWHGNPKIFNQDETNKITKTTYKELY